MKQVIRYECEYCGNYFATPDRHKCKYNPALKNCFSCKHLKGWLESDEGIDVGIGVIQAPNYPNCAADMFGWNIKVIKSLHYDMQCSRWSKK